MIVSHLFALKNINKQLLLYFKNLSDQGGGRGILSMLFLEMSCTF